MAESKESKSIEPERMTGLLKGKVVDRVEYTSVHRFHTEYDVNCDNGEVTIVFTDGSKVITWNSEWGSLGYMSRRVVVPGEG